VSNLVAGGTRMDSPRKLTHDESLDTPSAWTADGKAVLFFSNRNGTSGIFTQRVGQDNADVIATGPRAAVWPRPSPDGAWILYVNPPEAASSSVPLMRVPLSGGLPQLVLETSKGLNHSCARSPASLCVLLEESQDGKHLLITEFDPLKGRGRTLRTIEKQPSAHSFGSELSPDGLTFAIASSFEAEIRIRLLSLSGGSDREITVKGWPNLPRMGLHWSPEQKGFYCGSTSPQTNTLLYVDLKGNARVLWQYNGWARSIFGIPSPDGRYLAIPQSGRNSNVWLLEGF
jgi:Tol biopolymer transport system component